MQFCKVPEIIEEPEKKHELISRDVAEIKKKIEELVISKVSQYDKKKYPQYFGLDKRFNKEMLVILHCAFPCANEATLFLIYKNTTIDECIAISGVPLYVLGSSSFIGCEPYVPESLPED